MRKKEEEGGVKPCLRPLSHRLTLSPSRTLITLPLIVTQVIYVWWSANGRSSRCYMYTHMMHTCLPLVHILISGRSILKVDNRPRSLCDVAQDVLLSLVGFSRTGAFGHNKHQSAAGCLNDCTHITSL